MTRDKGYIVETGLSLSREWQGKDNCPKIQYDWIICIVSIESRVICTGIRGNENAEITQS